RHRSERPGTARHADPRLVGLSETTLRGLVPSKIFERGDGYCADGAVIEIAWRADALHAKVEGSEIDPYHVVVQSRGDRLDATCDCSYAEEWGGWCKHVVATLLVALRHDESIGTQPTVATVLASQDHA